MRAFLQKYNQEKAVVNKSDCYLSPEMVVPNINIFLRFRVNLFILQFLHHDHVHHLLAWAVMCLVRWCLSLKFSPHTCMFSNIFFFSGHRIHHYHQQKPAPLSSYQLIQSHSPIMINIFYSIIHSLKTWQRSRSVLRFFSKLLLSLLLWWLRMWNTAEIDITFSVQRYRIKLV